MATGEIGTRVLIVKDERSNVPSARGKKGHIIGHESIIGVPVPVIMLDDGGIIHGYECWWERYKEPVLSMYS
jgi:hypothetical protein